MPYTNLERRKEYMQLYRKEHAADYRSQYKEFLKAHPEYVKMYGRARYEKARNLRLECERLAHTYQAFL